MKARDVLRLLRISRPTLYRYVKAGKVKSIKLPNGQNDYNDDDVYKFLLKDVPRKTYIYARVSTYKQKNDLENQIEKIKVYCVAKGIRINGVFSDISSGISFDRRKEFFNMLEDILDNKVERIIISHKDRLSRVGFDLFKYLFEKYGTTIEVIDDTENIKTDEQELFEEIISLLHCFSMKMYSKRRSKKSVEVILNESNKN